MPKFDSFSLLTTLNLQGVAISAGIDPNGNLYPIAGGFSKLLFVAQDRSLPRIHTVVVHPETEIPDQINDLTTAVSVITASNLDELIEKLSVDQNTRWGEIVDYGEVFRKHQDFIDRKWLRKEVDLFIEQALSVSGSPAYLLITGRPGTGKTAFVANQVKLDPTSVYHFIRREAELDDPEIMLRSLTAQLRKIHALPIWPQEATNSTSTTFFHVLNRISEQLKFGERQIIWIDGLDEAFGPTGRFHDWRLDMILPLQGLPPGIVMIFTSRHDGPLDWIADTLLHKHIDLDDNPVANGENILQYLSIKGQSLGLELSPTLLMRLAEASEGCFAAAVRYLYPGPNLAASLNEWSENPEKIPQGLDGWLIRQWNVLLAAAKEREIPTRIVYGVLGYIAVQEGVISKLLQDDLYRTGPKILMHYLHSDEFERYMEPVLELSGEFFEVTSNQRGGGKRYRFFHSRFTEFVLQKVLKTNDNLPVRQELIRNFLWQKLIILPLGIILAAGLLYSATWLTPHVDQLLNRIASTPAALMPIETQVEVPDVFSSPIPRPTNTANPVAIPTPRVLPSPIPDRTGFVLKEKISLFLSPSTDAQILETLTIGTNVRIFGCSQDRAWLVVISPNHNSGWVQTNEVDFKAPFDELLEVLPLPTQASEQAQLSPVLKQTTSP